jgi:hypothetical protein
MGRAFLSGILDNMGFSLCNTFFRAELAKHELASNS